jgi:hypothetical protein
MLPPLRIRVGPILKMNTKIMRSKILKIPTQKTAQRRTLIIGSTNILKFRVSNMLRPSRIHMQIKNGEVE